MYCRCPPPSPLIHCFYLSTHTHALYLSFSQFDLVSALPPPTSQNSALFTNVSPRLSLRVGHCVQVKTPCTLKLSRGLTDWRKQVPCIMGFILVKSSWDPEFYRLVNCATRASLIAPGVRFRLSHCSVFKQGGWTHYCPLNQSNK